ncbi:MAG: cell division protein FtsQ/DivIB, partial [Clostridium sp.]
MGKTNNVYILKARRKRHIKRGIILTVIIAGVLALFVTKSDFFLIKNVNIKGNSIIKTEAIIKDADSFKGENLLFIKENNVISKIKSNPYIDNVTIKRSLPKTLEIDVTEKNVAYYFKGKENFDILSSDLILLEKSNKIDDKNLIEITGLKKDDLNIGDYISSGDSFTI